MADLARRLGRRIRELRKARGLTLAALAERLDISENYLGSLERGTRHPSLQLVEAIAQTLGVRVMELFQFPEEGAFPQRYEGAKQKLEYVIGERSEEEVELIVDIAKRIFKGKRG